MAERYFFFDDYQNDERIYGATEFTLYFAQLIGSGYTAKFLGSGISRYNPFSQDETAENLVVSANGQNMNLTISTGAAFIAGRGYFNDAAMVKSLGNANATMDRVDRIVLRLNLNDTERNIKCFVKNGQPSANPVAPELQQDERIKEISLARITVRAGKSFIDPADVRDERIYKELGGFLPLHNIYRGFQIDSNGISSQPNNSYVKVDVNPSNQNVPDRTATTLRLRDGIVADRQNEMRGDVFLAKTTGVYDVFVTVAFDEVLPVGTDIQFQAVINGTYDHLISGRTSAHVKDNYFFGTTMVDLDFGDEFEIRLYILGSLQTYTTRNVRVRIAKKF